MTSILKAAADLLKQRNHPTGIHDEEMRRLGYDPTKNADVLEFLRIKEQPFGIVPDEIIEAGNSKGTTLQYKPLDPSLATKITKPVEGGATRLG